MRGELNHRLFMSAFVLSLAFISLVWISLATQ